MSDRIVGSYKMQPESLSLLPIALGQTTVYTKSENDYIAWRQNQAIEKERLIVTEYGLQLYSLRDVTSKDLEKGLRAAAEIGYKMVEFAGFFGHPAEEVKGWLDKYSLCPIGTHTNFQELLDDFDGTVAYHKAIGCANLVIPSWDLSTKEKLDIFIDQVNGLIPRLAAEGIALLYHNHSHEFFPNKDGLLIHNELVKRTALLFEVDTYWAYAACQDPIATLRRLKDRVRLIHLKDGAGGHGARWLGKGSAPVAEVRKAALAMGLPMVVESEGLCPSGIEEAAGCFDYLKTLE